VCAHIFLQAIQSDFGLRVALGCFDVKIIYGFLSRSPSLHDDLFIAGEDDSVEGKLKFYTSISG
jgi:hypothetical protein